MDRDVASARLAVDEERLLRERASLIEELVDAEADSTGGPDGQPVGRSEATVAVFEREKDRGLVEQIDGALGEVAAARARVAAGTYGLCEECGRPIDPERLDALPAARLCVDDERSLERRSADFLR